MSSRRWIIFVISFVVIIIGAYQIIWRVFSLEDRLRNLIIAELQPNFKGKISIERVSINLQSLNLHNVSLKFENGFDQVQIRKLALGFSIFNVLKYNLNPIRFISDVIVEDPIVKLQNNMNQSKRYAKSSSLNLDSLETKYENKLIDFGFVGRFVVKNGSIILMKNDSTEIGLLSELKGWVSTTELAESSIRMKGRLFGSRNENIELVGQANLKTNRIDSVLINFKDNKLSTTIP